MLGDLLRSKRVWSMVVVGLVKLALHYHIAIPADVQTGLVDQLADAAGAILIVVTKIIDARKAKQ